MTIAAKVSAAELDAQVRASFENKWFEVALINSAAPYDIENDVWNEGNTAGGTNIYSFELDGLGGTKAAAGAGTANGYGRRAFEYVAANVQGYNDKGIPLARKTTVFSHNGYGTGDFTFTHAVLLHSGNGHATALGAVTANPTGSAAFTATGVREYKNLPVTGGSGQGLTIDLQILNTGTNSTDWVVTLVNPGTGYTASDSVTVPEDTLQSALNNNGGTLTGGLTFPITTVNAAAAAAGGTRDIVAVAKTDSAVTLTAGNEAVFYWDLKLFGYNA